jgi:hypothetical protein
MKKPVLKFSFQLGDNVTHLENNIAMVQEKARNDAELDDSWADYEGYGGEHSRHVSENETMFKFRLL